MVRTGPRANAATGALGGAPHEATGRARGAPKKGGSGAARERRHGGLPRSSLLEARFGPLDSPLAEKIPRREICVEAGVKSYEGPPGTQIPDVAKNWPAYLLAAFGLREYFSPRVISWAPQGPKTTRR